MKKFKSIVIVSLAISMFFSISGCGKQEATEETTHLNIAKQPVAGYTPLYIMENEGWLEEALAEAGYSDIEVKYTEFESGPPENESFAAGQQDLGVMGNVPAISGVAAGQKRKIMGVAYNGEQTLGILVKNDSNIENVSDLKGKKIGVVIGSINQDFLNSVLNANGLTMEDIELVNLGVAEMEPALANKQVDAVSIWNPTLLKIQEDGVGRLLADGTGIYVGENVLVVNEEYLSSNKEIVNIFMEQYARAIKELKSDFDRYAEEYAGVMGVDKDLLKKTWESCNFPLVMTDEEQSQLQNTADFLYEQKLVNFQVNIDEILDFSFGENDKIVDLLK